MDVFSCNAIEFATVVEGEGVDSGGGSGDGGYFFDLLAFHVVDEKLCFGGFWLDAKAATNGGSHVEFVVTVGHGYGGEVAEFGGSAVIHDNGVVFKCSSLWIKDNQCSANFVFIRHCADSDAVIVDGGHGIGPVLFTCAFGKS